MSRLDREANISSSEDNLLLKRGYKLLKLIGDGSYAKVYLCEYTKNNTKRRFACKLIDASKASRRFVHKFLPREIDILLHIEHPHIIQIHSILRGGNKLYVFMRFAERGDVLDYVIKHGAVTERQARVWFRQLAIALHYLHEMDIAHRDLKCENLLLTANYNIKIADFGFSRRITGPEDLSETYCGSLSYSAPEVLNGTPYDPKRADIWACGIVLYVIVNRKMPFDDSNPKRLVRSQLQRCWWFRSKIERKLSKQLKDFLPCLLEPYPAQRPTIDKITRSEWIMMDTDLQRLTRTEAEAMIKATQMKQLLATDKEAIEASENIQSEGNSLETDEPQKEAVEEAPVKEVIDSPRFSKKTAWQRKQTGKTVYEVKPAQSEVDLPAAVSVQHKYPWQKGKREEMFTGDESLLTDPAVVKLQDHEVTEAAPFT